MVTTASLSIKARWVFPITAPPIPDGVVTIDGARIVAVGAEPAAQAEVDDLGNVALLPGLINAHAHLELSDVEAPLGKPRIGLVEWIRRVIEHRAAGPAPRCVRPGIEESIRLGTTTLADVVQPDWPSEQLENAAIDLTAFLELIAPTPERVAPAWQSARAHLAAGRTARHWSPGLAPHAPYSVAPKLLEQIVSSSAAQRVPLAFHLAESREELELLASGGGPFRRFLQDVSAWHPDLVCPGSRPLDYLRVLARAARTLIVHGNYLDEEEIALMAEHAERMSIVYCPRTHAHFGHDRYPLEQMLSAGVNVALGTDSRASSPDLSVLAEMRLVAQRHPQVPSDVILQLATLRAARALGHEQELGSLEPGKAADLIVVALPECDAADPHQLLFEGGGPVTGRCFRGRLEMRPS